MSLTDAERARVDALIAYHDPITRELTARRTSYDSQLIPVTSYILVACAETFLRWPEMVATIDAALPAEQLALDGHRPGSRINSVHLWSLANFWLVGRKALAGLDPSLEDPDGAHVVLDFWDRAARAYRHDDGTRQAYDAGDVVRPYTDEVVAQIVDGSVPVDDELVREIRTFTATVVGYLFLLWFDTRVGTADSGPYALPDGRTLLVRDMHKLGRSEFWWSDVAAEVPYTNLVAGYVLDESVELAVSDFGSSTTRPDDYLAHLERFALFEVVGDERELRPVPLDQLADLVAVLRRVQARHYRNIVAMDDAERIRCGASVYFGFLRPFAEVAGVADHLDWEVPRALDPDVVELLVAIGREPITIDPEAQYYAPLQA